MILGAVLGLIFSAVTVYLGLKAGLTVAVNIPIAIIAMAFFAALMVGAVVCICASNAGNVAQALKTGYLLGCTPRKQEYGYIIGAFTSIFLIGFTVVILNNAFTDERAINDPAFSMPKEASIEATIEREGSTFDVYGIPGSGEKYLVNTSDPSEIIRQEAGIGSSKLPAPQARLMATVIDGVLNRRLPWVLILMGICLTIGVELCGVRALAFAVGVYLPLSTTMPIFAGGVIKWAIDKFSRRGKTAEEESGPGMLFSSGLIAGGALGGLTYAILTGFEFDDLLAVGPRWLGGLAESNWFGVLVFAGLCALLVRMALKRIEEK